MRVISLAPHQTQADLPALDLGDHLQAVADLGLDLDAREPLVEEGQQRRKQVLAGDGAGTERQVARKRRLLLAGDLLAGLSVEGQNPLRVVVETLTRPRQQDPTPLAVKEGHIQRLFKRLNALADRRLGQAQRLGGGGEAAQLSGS